jgi:hypothetical protein
MPFDALISFLLALPGAKWQQAIFISGRKQLRFTRKALEIK